jgi:hypothetical protein
VILSWAIGQDLGIAATAAAVSLVASWQYARTRANTTDSLVELLRTNVEESERRRKLDLEVHEAQVGELNRKLEEVRAEARALQTKAVDRLVGLVGETIAAQTREVLVEIRQHLTSIDSTTRTIRRGMGTRAANGRQDDAGDTP